MSTDDEPALLRRALDQLAGLLDDVPAGASGERTPCEDWSATPSAGDDPAARFRANADDLLRVWRDSAGSEAPVPLDWQCAELAVHTWDLTTALGRSTGDLDPEVAERGLAFMRASLTEDNRSPAFGPERPAPDGADAYQRLAAFAGRSV